MPSLQIRVLREADAPQLLALTETSGWNQELADCRRVLRLARGEAWGIETEGEIVASTTAVTYPGGPAWIGMVLTHPFWRGRGLARTLMNHALEQLETTGTLCQKLDATDVGRPLYKSLGFEELFAVERWEGTALAFPSCAWEPVKLEDWLALDREAFTDDRQAVLKDLADEESACVPGEGFAMARGGRVARYFGPCVTRNEDAARRLAKCLLARHPGAKFYWDLIPGHREAFDLACDLGFRSARRLVRMRRGGRNTREPWPQRQVFALAGFEFG